MSPRTLPRGWLLIAAAGGLIGPALSPAATYYVSAAASEQGDGSEAHPFASLPAVESASSAGDTIMVVQVSAALPPLDGGIALKPGQRLIGAGPPVIGRVPNSAAPRIGNTQETRLSGDAVRLSENTEVDNLVIVTARRNGIHGTNAADTRIQNNEITAVNTACSARVDAEPFKNASAAILMDFDVARSKVDIDGNFIHDSSCSDGIDVRAGRNAEVVASIDGNSVTRLAPGPAVGPLLGIGLESRDAALLIVNSAHNAETYLGSPAGEGGANCKGVYTHQSGGTIVWNIARNTFAHGSGGAACNGAAFIVAAGAARLHVVVRDSIFEDNSGDMLEEMNFGLDSLMDLTLDNVTIRHAAHAGPLMREAPVPEMTLASFDSRSVCVSQVSAGSGVTTRLQLTRSHLSDCAGDGILAIHANLPGLGAGRGRSSTVEIDQSSIIDVGEYALHWVDYATLDELRIRIQSSRLDGAPGFAAVAADAGPQSRIKAALIDLGGGVLGSLGLNCFNNTATLNLSPSNSTGVAYGANWWGTPDGALASPPPSCRLPLN